MKVIGYVRVSTEKQAEQGVSLDAQAPKIRAMAVVHGAELLEVIVDSGESAKSLQRPGMERLLALVDGKKVQAVIIAKLDRLTRSVKDLCTLLERFERRGVALISVAESRLCQWSHSAITVMASARFIWTAASKLRPPTTVHLQDGSDAACVCNGTLRMCG